jgi:Signal transduction histidine kinase
LSQQDFYFKDGSQGSLFYVVNMDDFKDMIAKNAIIVVLSALIILILTNGILTYFTSKSILIPLKELENAANKIKQGDLDYKINISTKDEIGEVGNSFEEMRLQLKESLELQNQYEENRKELISSISHDLKTPITSIKGYIEGIRDGVADTPEKMDKYITTIYTKATYMDNLINDLFLFSKLDLGREAFNFQAVDIRNYINDCVEEINFDLDHSLISLTSKVTNTPILVNIDVHQIKRTIMNIVGNSIKYKSNDKLSIDIIVTENSDYAVIEIRDNGKGIDNAALPYIFDRFYRADSSRETSIGGSGLGLAIAKKIIEEHEGSIWAESTLNKGTSIFFSLKKYRQ